MTLLPPFSSQISLPHFSLVIHSPPTENYPGYVRVTRVTSACIRVKKRMKGQKNQVK
ncbi:predicted protein [Botrytis cinerea T4]|uniref:Uncharacterized protein n=1 Tax=Botryotinia fuckeliana (strain T4) TaxID=999810 RepID=G2YFY0_BOTF4|nr:predicted protein [Botrytis cinerea T4]